MATAPPSGPDAAVRQRSRQRFSVTIKVHNEYESENSTG